MGRYTKKLKQSIISQMIPQKNKSISQLVKETGIERTTLCKRKKEASFQASFALADRQSTKNKMLNITFYYTET